MRAAIGNDYAMKNWWIIRLSTVKEKVLRKCFAFEQLSAPKTINRTLISSNQWNFYEAPKQLCKLSSKVLCSFSARHRCFKTDSSYSIQMFHCTTYVHVPSVTVSRKKAKEMSTKWYRSFLRGHQHFSRRRQWTKNLNRLKVEDS